MTLGGIPMPRCRRLADLLMVAPTRGGRPTAEGGRMVTAEGLAAYLDIRRNSRGHLPQQLMEQLAEAIRGGLLPAGTRLPSTRAMAQLLGVSRGVVVSAYELLLARGFVEGRPRSGTYVTGEPSPHRRSIPSPPVRPVVADFTPRAATAGGFPLAAWRSAWRQASYLPPNGEAAPLGSAALREAVAEHLHRTRGLDVEARDVVVAVGLRQACWFLFEAIGRLIGQPTGQQIGQQIGQREAGAATVAVEQPAPGYPVQAARQAGWTTHPLPADMEGARVDLLGGMDGVRAAVVFAEGNHPFGAVLSPARRRMLAEWARRTGGYLVDICTEQTGAGDRPLPSLLDLAGGRVILAGTLGDGLAPPGLAYLVLPRPLVPVVAQVAGGDDGRLGGTAQAAFTRLLGDRAVARHVRRVSRLHARRREEVRAALAHVGRPARLVLGPRGASAALLLPRQIVDSVVTELAGRGVTVGRLSDLYQVRAADAPDGIVLGFGHLTDEELHQGLQAVRTVLAGLTRVRAGRGVDGGPTHPCPARPASGRRPHAGDKTELVPGAPRPPARSSAGPRRSGGPRRNAVQRVDQLDPAADVQLAVGVGQMQLDGLGSDEQGFGDLAVGQAGGGQLGDPALC
ncbi:PLP-dependent aminotransferase family protein [Microbispora cellulosiformans]|uniref:PLP-dependent aminotransferase family protein n=1 Tax=Microbispora cellulosiformans TaxID=2614688 RepID=A0A5J5JVN7_9ACTN|nr:PLP-dependent aminotransferase family protein [Microbispora cellulosiformans]